MLNTMAFNTVCEEQVQVTLQFYWPTPSQLNPGVVVTEESCAKVIYNQKKKQIFLNVSF